MNFENPEVLFDSPSFFWNCITMSSECPFITSLDPNLKYFGITMMVMYTAFILIILADINFYWSLDCLHQRIYYYVNLVSRKVKHVQRDQKRLMTLQERTDKQIKETAESQHVLKFLRGALASTDEDHFDALLKLTNTDITDKPIPAPCEQGSASEIVKYQE